MIQNFISKHTYTSKPSVLTPATALALTAGSLKVVPCAGAVTAAFADEGSVLLNQPLTVPIGTSGAFAAVHCIPGSSVAEQATIFSFAASFGVSTATPLASLQLMAFVADVAAAADISTVSLADATVNWYPIEFNCTANTVSATGAIPVFNDRVTGKNRWAGLAFVVSNPAAVASLPAFGSISVRQVMSEVGVFQPFK